MLRFVKLRQVMLSYVKLSCMKCYTTLHNFSPVMFKLRDVTLCYDKLSVTLHNIKCQLQPQLPPFSPLGERGVVGGGFPAYRLEVIRRGISCHYRLGATVDTGWKEGFMAL